MDNVITNEGLKNFFNCLQEGMCSKLNITNSIHKHPVAKGDSTEIKWSDWLKEYLPKRYSVEKAFIIDYQGNISEQIDIVIFDKQYTPFIFNDNGALYIPAESVYAVLEVKQNLNKQKLEYAAKKAASVRKLCRTSAPVVHIEGISAPKEPHKILSGILALYSDWVNDSVKIDEHLSVLSDEQMINLGCIAQEYAFCVDEGGRIKKSSKDESIMYFFLKLLIELQKMGTVPAMDINKYAACLSNF